MEANKLFNENMTPDEARLVFFRKYREAKTSEELYELKAAYEVVSPILFEKALIEAKKGILID